MGCGVRRGGVVEVDWVVVGRRWAGGGGGLLRFEIVGGGGRGEFPLKGARGGQCNYNLRKRNPRRVVKTSFSAVWLLHIRARDGHMERRGV